MCASKSSCDCDFTSSDRADGTIKNFFFLFQFLFNFKVARGKDFCSLRFLLVLFFLIEISYYEIGWFCPHVFCFFCGYAATLRVTFSSRQTIIIGSQNSKSHRIRKMMFILWSAVLSTVDTNLLSTESSFSKEKEQVCRLARFQIKTRYGSNFKNLRLRLNNWFSFKTICWSFLTQSLVNHSEMILRRHEMLFRWIFYSMTWNALRP